MEDFNTRRFNKYLAFAGLILLCLFNFDLLAQNKSSLLFKGRVLNESGESMPDARVYSVSQELGVGTDAEGRFELILPKRKTKITVSYIGYRTQSVIIDPEEAAENGELYLEVRLSPAITGLPEVVVRAERRKTLIEEARTAVLDFDFLNQQLVVLVSERRRYLLRLYTEDGKLMSSLKLSNKPTELFRDCFGGVHLVYKDKVEELSTLGKSMIILATHSVTEFKKFLKPCVGQNELSLFMRNLSDKNQATSYYATHRASGKSELLHKVVDTDGLIMLEAEATEIVELTELLASGTITDPIRALEIEREIQQKQWFSSIILSQPKYHPFFQLADTAVIFDHLNNEALFFDARAQLKRRLPIDHHIRKDWGSRIFQDLKTDKLYLEFVKSGVSSLSVFDLSDGSYTPVWRIDDHAFPEKLKIREGKIFYIHRGVDQPAPALYSIEVDG